MLMMIYHHHQSSVNLIGEMREDGDVEFNQNTHQQINTHKIPSITKKS